MGWDGMGRGNEIDRLEMLSGPRHIWHSRPGPAPYMMPASWQSGSVTSFDISAHNPRKPLRTVADTDTDTPLHA